MSHTQLNSFSLRSHFLVALFLLAMAPLCVLHAQTKTGAAEPRNWSGAGSLGYTKTGGNTDTETWMPAISVTRDANGSQAGFGAKGAIGYFNDVATQENAKGFLVYREDFESHDKKFGKGDGVFYWGVGQASMYDAITGVDYRHAAYLGLGAHVLRTEKVLWDFEVGPGYLAEQVASIEDDYSIYRVGSYSKFVLSETAFINLDFDWTNSVEDSKDWILNTDLALTVAINKIVHLMVGGYMRYENIPPTGQRYKDWVFGTSLGVNF